MQAAKEAYEKRLAALPTPPYHPADYPGQTMVGNDGMLYVSKRLHKGMYIRVWKKASMTAQKAYAKAQKMAEKTTPPSTDA